MLRNNGKRDERSEPDMSDVLADLLAGSPESPGLGPIAARVRSLGLETLALDHARLLALLGGERGMRRALVAGRAAGHAAACLAHVAGDIQLTMIEAREEDAELLLAADVTRAPLLRLEGTLLETLPTLEADFDLIHAAGEISDYRRLLDLALTRTSVGGLIVLHGLRAEGVRAEAARAFCGYLLMHPQLQATVLDVGEGVALARKMKPLVTDLGGPFR